MLKILCCFAGYAVKPGRLLVINLTSASVDHNVRAIIHRSPKKAPYMPHLQVRLPAAESSAICRVPPLDTGKKYRPEERLKIDARIDNGCDMLALA